MKKLFFFVAIILILELSARTFLFFYNFTLAYQNRKYYAFNGGIMEYVKEYTSFKNRLSKKRVNRVTVTDFYNRRFYIPNFDIKLKTFNFRTNSLGMLSKEIPLSKNQSSYRIICLGSSTSINYPALLEKKLSETIQDKQIEVVNGSISGATILNSFMNFSLCWRELKPDMLIIDHNIDDIEADILPFYLANYKKTSYYMMEQLKYLMPFQSGILILSDIINSKILKGKINEPVQEGLDAFKIKLEALVLIAKGMNIKIVLLNSGVAVNDFNNSDKNKMEYFYKLYFSHFTPQGVLKVINEYNLIIKDVAEKNNVSFIDISRIVPKDDLHYRDLTHRTDAGDQALIDFLSPKIISLMD